MLYKQYMFNNWTLLKICISPILQFECMKIHTAVCVYMLDKAIWHTNMTFWGNEQQSFPEEPMGRDAAQHLWEMRLTIHGITSLELQEHHTPFSMAF